MTKKCFRCGKCCDNYFGIVPKTKSDNLAPRILEKMDVLGRQEYLKNHSELIGHPCKWLEFKEGLAHCNVYPYRSSDCRNYPDGEGDCRVGIFMKEEFDKMRRERDVQN